MYYKLRIFQGYFFAVAARCDSGLTVGQTAREFMYQ